MGCQWLQHHTLHVPEPFLHESAPMRVLPMEVVASPAGCGAGG